MGGFHHIDVDENRLIDVFNQPPPLSLYIHLPWCVKKCPYCDFNSHEIRAGKLAETMYVEALIRELEFELPRVADRQITSIFVGGGTPSLFSAQALAKLLGHIRLNLQLSSQVEITLEANPGTAEAGRFQAYREMGINRLSIGAQSFDDDKLRSLGRIHNANEVLQAIQMAKDAGFENINIDLMFGLPEQTVDEALRDLQIATQQSVTHISWYQLNIEPNTVFHKYPPRLPVDDAIWDMQCEGQRLLADKGYGQYEISAYAMAERRCCHNLNYWQFGDYLGLGAGAHGKLTDIRQQQITRFTRHHLPDAYMQKAGTYAAIIEAKILQDDDIILEFMMNALRLIEGFTPSLFAARTGLGIEVIQPTLDIADARGFIMQQKDRIAPTAKGRNYLNDLLQVFMHSVEP